jgi:hypothetical protein
VADSTAQSVASHDTRQKKRGKESRKKAPRSAHGDWQPAADRPDPIALLQAQDEGRLQNLVPIKYGRMLESPFAFLRGSAVVMAADLASTPASGLKAILCGDAHLSNFGLFATPERKLVFDLNDFDEVYVGAWEWDLKRLAASAVVAGRENGFSDKVCLGVAESVASTYRDAMEWFSGASTLDMWYYHVDADEVQAVMEDKVSKVSKKTSKRSQKGIAKARGRTQAQTLAKMTDIVDGQRRIVSNPPLLVPFRDFQSQQHQELANFEEDELKLMARQSIENSWEQYLNSLPDERRYLLQRYRIIDGALRVGGVGSVGTRCAILLLEARNADDAIILQLKEAGPSVLEPYFPKQAYKQHAARVVIGQRLVQASSDMFLGWHTSDRNYRNYYWRQLKDMKGSADVEKMDRERFEGYLKLCTFCLARAHARTGSPTATSGYIGSNQSFAKAIGKFALRYADQTEADHQALVDAVKSGRVVAESGV